MNNICTPATAARLKAAGFPQPAPAPGQVWYRPSGEEYLLLRNYQTNDWFVSNAGHVQRVFITPNTAFAPGVADLLRALGDEYDISTMGGQYIVFPRNDYDEILKHWVNDNPAEALAAAWLELHENPADLDDF